jgi:hypothetical protein
MNCWWLIDLWLIYKFTMSVCDEARRGGWGRERSITDRPGSTFPDFGLTEMRSRLPAQTLIVSSCTGNYLFYNAGFPICFSGALIPFCVCVFVATKKSASVWLRCQRSHRILHCKIALVEFSSFVWSSSFLHA